MSFDFVLDHRTLLAGVGAAATFAMVGVIWIVQLVHYPSFAFVDATRYAEFQNFHERNITFIVLPLMLVEALCAFALLASAAMGTQVDGDPVGKEMFTPSAIGLGLVVFLWGWTALVSVPFHARLAGGFDPDAWRGLVLSNWARTAAWTVRGILSAWVLRISIPS